MRAALVVALGIASLSGPATAQVNKWIDPQGRVYYGDQPPARTLVKEKPVHRGAVSYADGAHFQSAPGKWTGYSRGGGGVVQSGSAATPVSRAKAASSGGYWRCD